MGPFNYSTKFLWILIFTVNISFGQDKDILTEPTKESIASFYNTIEGINWGDFNIAVRRVNRDTLLDCFEDFKIKMKNIPKMAINKEYNLPYLSGMSFFISVQTEINNGIFHSIDFHGKDFLKYPIRDHIFTSILTTSSFEAFKKAVKGTGDLTDTDILGLFSPYQLFFYEEGKHRENALNPLVAWTKKSFLDCEVAEKLELGIKSIDVNNEKVTWILRKTITIECPCSEKNGKSLENVHAELHNEITSTYRDGGIYNMIFTKASKPSLYYLKLSCCEDSKNGEDNDDKDDHGSYQVPGNGNQNCCANGTANYSVGLFPVINFGNNFEDSTIGIGVEGLVNMGASFGNNEWFAGIGGQYLASSAQNGDIKENFYSGSAIVENRTPILPCLQWTQRLCGQYGMGTYKAFGNQDDFTQTLIELHTGVNLDLSENIAIGLDGALVRYGNQTFKQDGGEDIKTDIGNFNLGQNNISLGVRFKF